MALPRLEPPDDALVLFERVPDGADRSRRDRFAVTADGRFLHGRNGHFEVDDDRSATTTTPALFWAGPLDEVASFDDGATGRRSRSSPTRSSDLPDHLRRPPGKESGPVTERITTFNADIPRARRYSARHDRRPSSASSTRSNGQGAAIPARRS